MKLAALIFISASALAQSDSPGYAAYRRGAALFDKAQFQESLTELDRALALDPKLVPALTLKSKLSMSLNRYDVARECLDRALSASPSSANAQFLLGFLNYRQDRIPEAKKELQKARTLNPSDPRAALYLGLTEETLGQTSAALFLYREAIRLEEASGKPHAEAWNTYARLLMVTGDLAGAEKLIDRSLKIEPGARDGHFEAGRLLLKKGLPLDAAKEGEVALKLPGEVADTQVHVLLVNAYGAAGREQEAERHAEAIRAAERK
jgi:Flp pilus assembly protein TadD